MDERHFDSHLLDSQTTLFVHGSAFGALSASGMTDTLILRVLP